jgi:nucleoside-diphosphate-sugar epimerase
MKTSRSTRNPLRPNNTYSASKAAMEMVLRGLWGNVPLDLCSLRFTVIYGPGRETTYTVEEIVGAALAGKIARIAPVGDWPYVYIDDAARAAAQACYAKGRRQLSYFIAHQERVTPDDIAAAAAAAGRPVRIEIDASRPRAERGPLDVEPAARDFGFRAQVGYREGVRRLIESAR